jgi:hypothetical protein
MTPRERIEHVFAGKASPLPPVSIRLDLWHRHGQTTGQLPGEVAGMTHEEVEDYLGFCRTARYRPAPRIDFGPGVLSQGTEGEDTIQEYHLPGRTLRRATRRTEENRRAGIVGHITEYPIKDEGDAKALLKALDGASIRFDNNALDALIARTGDKGLPMYILGASPIHTLMLSWAGYVNFYYLQNDCPDTIDQLVAALDRVFRRDLWSMAAQVTPTLLLHGAHFSGAMTPEPIFRRYFLPYFTAFNDAMHRIGKKVVWHSDAELGRLVPIVPEAGFDGADCLATYPLTDMSMSDYLAAWKEKIVCWGGLPSVIFDPTYPSSDFRKYVDDLKRATAGRSHVIIGASDNVLPGAQWEKLLYAKAAFAH